MAFQESFGQENRNSGTDSGARSPGDRIAIFLAGCCGSRDPFSQGSHNSGMTKASLSSLVAAGHECPFTCEFRGIRAPASLSRHMSLLRNHKITKWWECILETTRTLKSSRQRSKSLKWASVKRSTNRSTYMYRLALLAQDIAPPCVQMQRPQQLEPKAKAQGSSAELAFAQFPVQVVSKF